jgi:hypothetical protein
LGGGKALLRLRAYWLCKDETLLVRPRLEIVQLLFGFV